MLIRAALIALAVAAAARAEGPEGLRQPRKLTVALSDELLGQLAPDGRHLYFVSNRNATNEIFVQDLAAPMSTLLFDEAADVTWPRVSPDGRHLLYLSFRDDASAALCVRALPSLARRCLESEGGALQAVWLPGGEIALLARPSVHGDLRLRRVHTDGGKLTASPLLERNLTGLAASPDGRWLAFVPIERAPGRIGPAFAAQAGRQLVLRTLDGTIERAVRFDLPGATGQPAFSPDGRWLYFTQYLNDTDGNGVLDGDDHGVLFRAPLQASGDGAAIDALARAVPQQLTSASWNCQYPAPARDRLIMTCERDGSLDLYSLPVEGVIPERWDGARLRDELRTTRDPWERLLLAHRLERAERDPARRAPLRLEVIRHHLALREYESAAFHARGLAEGGGELAPLGPTIEALIAHRRALRAFDRGQLGVRFLDDSRRVLDELAAAPAGESAAAAALRHLVRCEILDHIGDKEGALREVESAPVDERTPAFVIHRRADRAESIYRELDRPDDLARALRPLAEHPALDEEERIALAGTFARTVVRGRPAEEREAIFARERARAPDRSAIAFAIDLERCLAQIAPSTEAAGRACVDRVYQAHPSLERRRALVAQIVRRAEDEDADALEYELARRWVRDVPAAAAERPHAERLFRHVVEDHAYLAWAAGKVAEARDEFDMVIREIDSLESHIGFIETSFAAGAGAEAIEAGYRARYAKRADAAVLHFARAYLAARRLPTLDGAAYERAFATASDEVQAAERGLAQKCEIQALHGSLLHLRFLRDGERAAAEEANVHYLLALELAHKNGRYRGMVLDQLGALDTAVGNYRAAIGFLDQRASLPFVTPLAALGHHLTRARALLHVGRDRDAAAAAEAALAIARADPPSRRSLPLLLDRAALYALAGGAAPRAVERYDELLAGPAASSATGRNPIVWRLGRAAAKLASRSGAGAIADLDVVAGALPSPSVQRGLAWPFAEPGEVRTTYDLLQLGLRAQAERSRGALEPAQRSLEARLALLRARFSQRDLDEDLLALALAEAQAAALARDRGHVDEAAAAASRALEDADAFAHRTGSALSDAQLDVLSLAAELHLRSGARRAAFRFDLRGRLEQAYRALCDSTDPKLRPMRRRFASYVTLMALDGQGS